MILIIILSNSTLMIYCKFHFIYVNLNVDELKAFLGILIIMDFNKLPSICIYWSADENFYNPRIANVMT